MNIKKDAWILSKLQENRKVMIFGSIQPEKKKNWTTGVELVEVLISFSLAFQPQPTGVQIHL